MPIQYQYETLPKPSVDNSEGLKTEIYENETAFDTLSDEWKDLAVRADAMVFGTYEWSKIWWKYFGSHARRSVCIIALWDSEKLVALAPFYKAHSSAGGFITVKRLQLIGSGGNRNEQFGYKDDYGISDFLDILVDKNYQEVISDLLCDQIAYVAAKDRIDFINLLSLREDSFVMRFLYPKLKGRSGVEINARKSDVCPFVDLTENPSLKEFVKSVKSNARRRFRQTLRAMDKEGTFSIEEITVTKDLEIAVERMIKLHQNRWNRIGFPGVFYDQRFRKFFRELVSDAFENDRLWFKQATDANGVCAMRMVLCYNGRYFDYISGFDDESDSAKVRPGIGLLLDLVSETTGRGDNKTLELLRGEETYKYDFTTKTTDTWKLQIHFSEQKKSVAWLVGIFQSGAAALYTHINRELCLMNVQRLQKGSLRMISGYLQFRWQSLRIKLRQKKDV
jgi:hypothetical protein